MSVLSIVYLLVWVVIIILIADFISGLGHWFEDVYGHPNWPLIGKYVVQPNIQHHLTPRSFLKASYFNRNSTSFFLAAIIILFLLSFQLLNWQLILLIGYLSQVNEVHAISHRRKDENSVIIRFIQRIGLIQGNLHHGWHHKAPYDCNYCIMTQYVNPILDKLKFWQRIEFALKRLGIHPLRGTAIRNGM